MGKKHETQSEKQTKQKGLKASSWRAEHLQSRQKALNSNLSSI
jgi:hypothetical protein